MNPPSLLNEAELQELVRKAQNGDTEAFGKLYDHFFDPVYRYVRFRLASDLVEDTVADIFVRAWEKIGGYSFRWSVPFGAWIFRIARNIVIDTYRSHRGMDELPEVIVDEDILNRADTRIHRKDLLRIVRAAMAKLPKRYQEILTLSFVSELPHHEVARVLRMTQGGVRILKMRALRKLQSELPPDIGLDA
ncbi:sigma-70 family RNA polymerase sigma factor [Candidatus Peregrinibacteria bacterium]|nr:sigma-70 family RNA polymerase sigma factor [Candidatus Peregrinibacteria bacterium]